MNLFESTENMLSTVSLKDCPVRITTPSREKIALLTRHASSKSFDYEPVKVAAVTSKKKTDFLIVDGHDVVTAFRKNNIDSIKCKIFQVSSMTDAIVLHVTLHQNNPVNPLNLVKAFGFLKDNGLEDKSLDKTLLLNKKQRLLQKCDFSPRAIELLDGYFEELTSTFESVTSYPYYLLIRIGKIPKNDQEAAVRHLINSIDLNVSEQKFSFPSAMQLDMLIKPSTSFQESPKTVVFAKDDDNKDTLPVEITSTKSKAEVPMISSHEIFMECSCSNQFIIDAKKHTVSPIYEQEGIRVVKGDLGKPVGVIPSKVMDELDLGNAETIHSKVLSVKGLEKLVNKAAKKSKFFIVSADEVL